MAPAPRMCSAATCCPTVSAPHGYVHRIRVVILAELAWPILERIRLGGFEISPHGIMIALGFLLGAQMVLRRATRRGVARHHVQGIELIVQSLVTRAAIGGIL